MRETKFAVNDYVTWKTREGLTMIGQVIRYYRTHDSSILTYDVRGANGFSYACREDILVKDKSHQLQRIPSSIEVVKTEYFEGDYVSVPRADLKAILDFAKGNEYHFRGTTVAKICERWENSL